MSSKDPRLANIWNGMKQRCNNPNHSAARWYHDRGIRVCKEWNDNFYLFQAWAIANGYADGLSIDRIDPDGDYCPENCRWITLGENRRRARKNGGRKQKCVPVVEVKHDTQPDLKPFAKVIETKPGSNGLTAIAVETLGYMANMLAEMDKENQDMVALLIATQLKGMVAGVKLKNR